MPSFITAKGLEALDNYKYVSGGYSPFDNFVNPFWEFCVTLLPLWLAPNLVTAIGTLACVFHHIVVAFYATNLDEPLPWWLLVLGGLSVFFYNTMDSIDGKQARRTKASSPLGQLFDHGCDGFQTMCITLSLITALGMGPSLTTLLFITSIQVPFFLAQWEEYHTHVIRTNVGWFGVTEGQYLTVLLFLVTPLLPEGFWEMSPFLGVTYCQLLCGGFMLAPGYMTLTFFQNTFSKAKKPLVALQQLVPLVVNMACLYAAFYLDGVDGTVPHMTPNPRLFFSTFMFLNVYFITVIIVMNLAKQPFPCYPTILLAPILLVANAWFGVLPATWALVVALLYVIGSYLNFCMDCINTICRHRNIYCFKLGPRAASDR